jgi:copper homeostasis protein (lipoprotein)
MSHFIPDRLSALVFVALTYAVAGSAWAGTVDGTAAYRERMMLPPDAVFEAQLQDISRADAPAEVLGRARLDPAGQPPFRFEIAYDDAAVERRGRYAVRATVTRQGQLLFTTDRIHPVLDGRDALLDLVLVSARADPQGASPATALGELPGARNPIRWHLNLYPEGRFQLRTTHLGRPAPNQFDDIGRWRQERELGRIVLRGGRERPVFLLPVDGGAALRKLDLEGNQIDSANNDRLQRQPQFKPIEPRLFLSGMFVYLADVASIVLCADNRSVPVAMEVDHKALEAAYMEGRTEAGERLLVSLEGLPAPRPSMEESRPPRITLVVERFVGVWPGQRCPASP